MDTVVLDGVTYIKASAAATQFRYTADYVGQLCRSGKVDARLVGRTWFVDPTSIRQHKKTKHQAPRQSHQAPGIKTVPQNPHTVVSPVITTKSAKAVAAMKKTQDVRRTQYEADDAPLMPALVKEKGRSVEVVDDHKSHKNIPETNDVTLRKLVQVESIQAVERGSVTSDLPTVPGAAAVYSEELDQGAVSLKRSSHPSEQGVVSPSDRFQVPVKNKNVDHTLQVKSKTVSIDQQSEVVNVHPAGRNRLVALFAVFVAVLIGWYIVASVNEVVVSQTSYIERVVFDPTVLHKQTR